MGMLFFRYSCTRDAVPLRSSSRLAASHRVLHVPAGQPGRAELAEPRRTPAARLGAREERRANRQHAARVSSCATQLKSVSIAAWFDVESLTLSLLYFWSPTSIDDA